MTDEIFLEKDALDVVEHSMKKYAETVVLRRAIPDVRDGLKVVHRRILYTLSKNKMTSNGRFNKLAKVSGLVMGYHPHGDASINEATSLLTQPWRQNHILVETEGNNGSIDGDSAAAARYLEVRLASASDLLVRSLKDNSVDMVPSYDDTDEEPVVLPAEYPNLFVNGGSGIAVGFSSVVAPHNARELLDLLIAFVDNPEMTLDEALTIMPGPDLPTGGYIIKSNDFKSMYRIGKGSFIMRSKVEIEGNSLIITEIPYGITKTKLKESIGKAFESCNLLGCLNDVDDESVGDEIRIVIKCKRQTDMQSLLEILYKKSNLQISFHANHVVISNGKPVLVGLLDYVRLFLNFRVVTLRRLLKTEWDKRSVRLHLVEGLLKLRDVSGEVIQLIKTSDSKQDSIEQLQVKFGFSEAQSEAIVNLRLYRIGKQDMTVLEQEKTELLSRLEELSKLASDKAYFNEYLKVCLKDAQTYFKDDKRKTVILDKVESIEINPLDMIQDVKVHVAVRPNGVQRMSPAVYNNNVEEFGGDILFNTEAVTSDAMLLFTKQGFAMQRLVDDIENNSIRNDVTDLHRTLTAFKQDDEIIGACKFSLADIQDEQKDLFVLFVTHKGMVKLSKLSDLLLSFGNKGYLNRMKKVNGLKIEGDYLVGVYVLTQDELANAVIEYQKVGGRKSIKKLPVNLINLQGASGSGRRLVKCGDGEFVQYLLDFNQEVSNQDMVEPEDNDLLDVQEDLEMSE